MSAAMVKLGVYGMLRLGFDLLGGGARWWWLTVAAVGALSALYGIVQAVVATDLKRLLAFSTAENIGLILLGVGFAGMFARLRAACGGRARAGRGAAAHVNHAGFKTLLFLGAGSVVKATGTRDLDQLGGLSQRMAATTALVARGALAPRHSRRATGSSPSGCCCNRCCSQGDGGTVLAIAAPVAVAVIALTAGVGVATYVKPSGGIPGASTQRVPPSGEGVAAEHAGGDGRGGHRLRRTRRGTDDDGPGDRGRSPSPAPGGPADRHRR